MSAVPRVSVTTPAFDADATIRETVASVLSQTMGDLELIVVDDGSRVPVAEALGDVGDPRLRVVRIEHTGLAGARNAALAAARAPLVAHVDADDLVEPEFLAELTARLEDPAVGLAYCNVLWSGAPGGDRPYVRDRSRHPAGDLRALLRANPIPNFVVMRTAAVRAVGGYEPGLWGAMDWMLYLELAAAGWRFAYVDRILGEYRWSASNLSHDWDKVQRANLQVLWRFARRHPRAPIPWGRIAALAGREAYVRVPGLARARRRLRGHGR